MRPALHRLLASSIDYAGLFPPARLDLPEALASYRAYVKGPEAWIVDRFVVPTSRLADLADLISPNAVDAVPLSVVGRISRDRLSWEEARADDARDMAAFQARIGDLAPIEAYEVKLPDNAGFNGWVKDLHGFRDADVFAELRWDDDMLDAAASAAEAEWINLKARTGGETAEAFPSAAVLAGFLQAAIQLDVPFKLTAGLHHPLPSRDPVIGAAMHGFLNVFVGAAIASANDLSVREWETLLLADKPEFFHFGESTISALGFDADLDAIDLARDLLVGFGSCSVVEPLEGLADLNLNHSS